MGRLSNIRAEMYKNRIILFRNFFRLFDISIWPIILFFSITLFLRFISPTPEIMSMVITGLIGWRAVYHLQIESNLAYMDDYWTKNTSQVLTAPIKIVDYITSGIVTGIIKFLIVLTIYLVFAYTLFSFRITDMFKFIIGVSYLAFCGLIIGLIVFGFLVLYRHVAITFAFMLPDLFVLLSGVYYPISIFPSWMIKFVHILPTFYGFELLKSMSGLGSVNYPGMIIVGLIWFIGAVIFLKWCIKKAKKDGSLCHFN